MRDSHMALLLQLIRANAGVEPLVALGLRYSQIDNMIRKALEAGLIIPSGTGLKLTEGGIAAMRTDPRTQESRRDGGWISPDERSRIAQWPKNKVYLPRRSKHLSEE
jgi:hypothetical protein